MKPQVWLFLFFGCLALGAVLWITRHKSEPAVAPEAAQAETQNEKVSPKPESDVSQPPPDANGLPKARESSPSTPSPSQPSAPYNANPGNNTNNNYYNPPASPPQYDTLPPPPPPQYDNSYDEPPSYPNYDYSNPPPPDSNDYNYNYNNMPPPPPPPPPPGPDDYNE